jgi:hypothetical protein
MTGDCYGKGLLYEVQLKKLMVKVKDTAPVSYSHRGVGVGVRRYLE